MITLARQDVTRHETGVSWPHWVRDNGPVDRLVCTSGLEAVGWPTPRGVCGAYTTPIDAVLGLKAWDDAREGVVVGDPWVIFDIEKLVRMLLRQSPIAYRFFASHVCLHEISTMDRQRILNSAVSAQMVRNIAIEAQNELPSLTRRGALLEQLASVTTGWALARGIADLHAETILKTHPEWSDLDVTNREDIRRAATALAADLLTTEVALPVAPSDYDGLSQWLVQRRLQTLT